MTGFENAKKFFDACESCKGWEGCKPYVADGATFTAQSEPIADMNSVQTYCDWMAGMATIAPDCSYDLHASSYDEVSNVAIFFATFHAKHTGEGGPVPPTNKETHSHYVYILSMDTDNKVKNMVKVWNAPWAFKEIGWM